MGGARCCGGGGGGGEGGAEIFGLVGMVFVGAALKDGTGGSGRDGVDLAARKGDAWVKDLICDTRLRSRLTIGRDAILRPVVCSIDQNVAEDGIDFLNYSPSNPASHAAKSCKPVSGSC